MKNKKEIWLIRAKSKIDAEKKMEKQYGTVGITVKATAKKTQLPSVYDVKIEKLKRVV